MTTAIDPLLVQRFHAFRDLNPDQARAAAESLEALHVTTGAVLFREGAPGDAAYVLASGRVEIRVSVPGQEDRVLATLLSGAILGEISLLLDEPRTATAI